MNIIYAYSNCTNKKYKKLFPNEERLVLRADQKYHSLLIRGLAENGVKVDAVSSLPINRETTKRLFIKEADETEGNATYHYYRSVNLPVLRQIMVFFAAFFNVLKAKRDSYLVCDYQNAANAYGVLLAAKLRKIPTTVIVMDLPDFLTDSRFIQKIYGGTFRLADSFVLLTEQMNEVVNKKKRPYIVIEGIADYNIKPVNEQERFETSLGKKVVIYAGSIAKRYGVQNLTDGFIQGNIPNAELWIYGDGDYREELVSVCEQHENVKYKGVCSNEEVVSVEQRAALLVNPRPAAPSYTRYSFPSKNMEYMASGTPVLTTDLPGMPEEYHDYVFLIERSGETPEKIAETLKNVFEIDMDERNCLGKKAREFVLKEKSNVVQARKLINCLGKFDA